MFCPICGGPLTVTAGGAVCSNGDTHFSRETIDSLAGALQTPPPRLRQLPLDRAFCPKCGGVTAPAYVENRREAHFACARCGVRLDEVVRELSRYRHWLRTLFTVERTSQSADGLILMPPIQAYQRPHPFVVELHFPNGSRARRRAMVRGANLVLKGTRDVPPGTRVGLTLDQPNAMLREQLVTATVMFVALVLLVLLWRVPAPPWAHAAMIAGSAVVVLLGSWSVVQTSPSMPELFVMSPKDGPGFLERVRRLRIDQPSALLELVRAVATQLALLLPFAQLVIGAAATVALATRHALPWSCALVWGLGTVVLLVLAPALHFGAIVGMGLGGGSPTRRKGRQPSASRGSLRRGASS